MGRLIFFVLSVLLTGCEPDEGVKKEVSSPAEKTIQVLQPNHVDETVLAAVEYLRTGDFEGARAILDAGGQSPGIEQLRLLMAQYDRLQSHRLQERKKAYEEQIAEIQKIEQEATGQEPIDANTIDNVMIAVIKAREYAADDEKAAVLDRPFVQQTIEVMRSRGQAYRQEGKWMDAYTHCYYWLVNLFEENQAYKDLAERLMQLASVELSLKDSSCGESAVEQYAGIKPEMLLRALNALEINYVNGVEYAGMAQKALERCKLLGEVLLKSPEKLAWRVGAQPVANWQTGLEAISDTLEPDSNTPMPAEQYITLFDEVLSLNKVTLNIPQEVVIAHFSEASLAALDPFTTLVWPWNVKDFEKSLTQQFTGIGVEISKATGVLKILSLLPDTPAYKSGLDADDEILAVNGESTKDMTIFCVVSKITGPKGTRVTLTVRRPTTGKTWDVDIFRDRIVVQPLRGGRRTETGGWDYRIDPENGIGYIRLTAFTETSGPDLDKTLKELEKKGLNALILDLRFNSGGYLSSAAEIVDLFVNEGVIVKSSPRHGFATYEIAHRSGTHPNYPLIILINTASASASEIVAGALQDAQHQRAVLVGERSYGKGSVQVVIPYTGGGSQLKYTVAYYHLPSDQPVKNRYQMERLGREDWGIAPDVEVKMYSNEMRAMLDLQRDNDVLFRADHGQDGKTPVRHALEMTLKADPQLYVALMVARAKLIAEGKTLVLAPIQKNETAVVKDDSK